MAFTVQIIDEAGTTHTLSGGTTSNFIQMAGVGVASVERNIEPPTNTNIYQDRGFRLAPRRIDLTLYISEASASDADATRDTIASIFEPTQNPLNLKITRQDAAVRQIDVYLDGQIDYPVSIDDRVGEFTQKIVVPLLAPNPIFYDPTEQTVTVDLSSGSGNAVMSASGLTWYDYPVIEVDGPITDLNINPTGFSAANLSIFGSTIASGRTYTFDLRPDFKTITDDLSNNKLSELVLSSLNNMHGMLRVHSEKFLAAYVSGSPSSTTFAFSGSSTTGATEARVIYYKRYLSL